MNSKNREKPIELLTFNEAADFIGISPSILSYFVEMDSIPIIAKRDGIFFEKSTAYRWKKGLEIKPNREIGEQFKGEINVKKAG
ncbi:MAG: hypothetical protein IJG38_07720 [Thermoguttaceae bacterium]|nr:hypothetical protein [Thermoguttaceae bacterium]